MMKAVDFYFDFSSINAYFAAFMLPEICRPRGARINWLPLHLGAVFRGTGFDATAMPPAKARYLRRDHMRYAQRLGLPLRWPSRFPIKTSAALRGVLAARRVSEDAAVKFSLEVFRAHWERDADIADPEVVGAAAERVGLDRRPFLASVNTDAVREELAAVTARAIERGVFGAPTFFVGEEMFWGKDRLDFVERLL